VRPPILLIHFSSWLRYPDQCPNRAITAHSHSLFYAAVRHTTIESLIRLGNSGFSPSDLLVDGLMHVVMNQVARLVNAASTNSVLHVDYVISVHIQVTVWNLSAKIALLASQQIRWVFSSRDCRLELWTFGLVIRPNTRQITLRNSHVVDRLQRLSVLNYFGSITWLLIIQIRYQDSCAVRLHQSLTSLWRKRGFLRLESHVLPSILLMHLDAWWWQILTLSLTLDIALDLHVNHMGLRRHRWVIFFLDSHLGSILILHW